MSFPFYEINESDYGQFVDIEKQIIYVLPNEENEIIYITTYFSLFQLIMIFVLIKVFHIL